MVLTPVRNLITERDAMRSLSLFALLVFFALPAIVTAQTVRFRTNVGDFDMLLNPTNNPDLQPHVDNLLAYVGAGRYHCSVINRAPDNFVLQMGGFLADSMSIDSLRDTGFMPVSAFDPVIVDANNDGQVDFDTTGLTNARGTVSLALSAGNANSGTSSFFVNSVNNAFLDSQNFIPFATISDMAPLDRIMGLEKRDLSITVGQPGSLAYTDVPFTDAGEFVLIESASVISQNNAAFIGPVSVASSSLPAPQPLVSSPAAIASTTAVPEPGCLMLGGLAIIGIVSRRSRRS